MSILKNLYPVALLITIAVLISPINVQADEIPARGPIPFVDFDKDSDGLISEEEFNTARGERMAKRAAEGKRMRGASGAPAFSEFDSNSDGQLSIDELAAGHKAQMEKHRRMRKGKGSGMERNCPAFSEFDLDGDGKILENEFNEARSKRISDRAQQGYQMKNLGNAVSFTDIDTNEDGEINAEEFAVHQSQHRKRNKQ